MNYTYNWQPQPQVAWKGKSTNSVTKSWSRPFSNGSATPWASGKGYEQTPLNSGDGTGFWGKPRPLKQWRKQLNPRLPNHTKDIGMPMDIPGGSVYLGADSTQCSVKDCSNSYFLKDNNSKNSSLQIVTPTSSDSFYDSDQNKMVCVACNPENNIIKEKVQPLQDSYTEYGAYLHSRAKKYSQRTGRGISGVYQGSYFNESGKMLYPSNASGPPEYYYPASKMIALRCDISNNYTKDDNGNITGIIKSKPYIYKPSNPQFSTQGAVSGGSRISKLKENTINFNRANTVTANGLRNVNNGNLNMNTGSGYFVKVKPITYCKPYRPSGSHTLCWTTPTGSIVGRVGRGNP